MIRQKISSMIMGSKVSKPPKDDKYDNLLLPEHHLVDKTHFLISGLLGEGGFGKVTTGMCVKNSHWYAIKEIKKTELLKHKCGVAMLFGELKSMARVNHPFVINLHFAFHDRRRCFLVLDLKTGGDLRYYLRKRMIFEEIDVAFYVACLSSALDHIHSRGIIHRDIKPENIILDEKGYPYLTDFGVSHVLPEWEYTLTCNLASGTKQYLAPEVFTKPHIHGPEVDFWGLGVVAYELLFGKRPFEKHCPVAMISYLERALAAKRKQTKENKMKELFCGSNGLHSPVAGLDGTERSRDFCESPHHSMEFPSPVLSKHNNGVSNSNNKFPRPTIKSTSADRLSASIKVTNNTDATSQDRVSAFCTSVGYTQAATGASDAAAPQKHIRSAATLTHESYDHHSVCFSVNGTQEHNFYDSDAANHHDGIKSTGSFGTVTGNSPAGGKLPNLKPLPHCSTPPRRLFTKQKQLPQQQPLSSPVRLSGNNLQSPTRRQDCELKEEDEYEEDNLESGESASNSDDSSIKPGDHWLVDDGPLPKTLVVEIPEGNSWLGIISTDCQRVLSGLFECRPKYRLGGRNMSQLRRCHWFEIFKLNHWDDLRDKTFSPHFQPGRRFVKDCLEQNPHRYDEGRPDSDSDPTQDSTASKHDEFEGFYFVSEAHQHLFPGADLHIEL